MKIAYFDCFSGISGDMVVGSFIDAGIDIALIRDSLRLLDLDGYSVRARRVARATIGGTKFDCLLKGAAKGHHHATLRSILALIKKSRLNGRVKELSSEIFLTLGKAEAKVHTVRLEDVHFHEVGNIDSIVDIVSCAVAVDALKVDAFHCSEIVLGRGYAATQVGVLPVPSPATLQLLKGIPVSFSRVEAELVTPTGAAIARTICMSFGALPPMKITAVGYGAGSKDIPGSANLLRFVVGESEPSFARDTITVIETSIDDMNPQIFDYLFERLFAAGALDVSVAPVHMKKNRPGFTLTVLAENNGADKLCRVIFEETTSIGVRYHRAERMKLDRTIVGAATKYGTVRVKIASGPGGIRAASPEYDDCVRLARQARVPLKAVFEEAKKHFGAGLRQRARRVR